MASTGAYDVALSPEGHFVYVAGLFDDGVAILQRNASTGRLTWQGSGRGRCGRGRWPGRGQWPGPVPPTASSCWWRGGGMEPWRCLTGMPLRACWICDRGGRRHNPGPGWRPGRDGQSQLPSGRTSPASTTTPSSFLTGRSRGGSSTLEVEQDGEGGVDGLATANGLAVSPDGRCHLGCRGGHGYNALAIFGTRADLADAPVVPHSLSGRLDAARFNLLPRRPHQGFLWHTDKIRVGREHRVRWLPAAHLLTGGMK